MIAVRRRFLVLLAALVLATLVVAPVAAQAPPPTYDRTLGGPLHAEINPSGLEVAPDGTLVVADTGNNQIVKYGLSSGQWVERWRRGTWGAGTGNFDNPRDVGVDTDGTIYVADTVNNRIVRMTPRGDWAGVITAPAGEDPFSFPLGITVANSKVYLADTGRSRVRVFSQTGAPLGTFGGPTAIGDCNTQGLRDATADAVGNVYVANYSSNEVTKFPAGGGQCQEWGTTGEGNGQFKAPYGVAIAQDPHLGGPAIYVADANNNRVQEFTLDGGHVATFGVATGEAEDPDTRGKFFALRRVAARDGQVWGSDLWGNKAELYVQGAGGGYSYSGTAIGRPLPDPTDEAVFQEPRGVGFATDGTPWIANTVHHQVVHMGRDGALDKTCGMRGAGPAQFNWPRGVAVDHNTGRLWVLDTKQNRLQIINPASPDCDLGAVRTGRFGHGSGQFNWPHSIAMRQARGGSPAIAWIADTFNDRVLAYKPNADPAKPPQLLGTYGVFEQRTKLYRPAGIAVKPDGKVLVADTENNRIVELTNTNGTQIKFGREYKARLNKPEGVASDKDGRIYIADSGNNRAVVLNPNGSLMRTIATPTMQHPSNIATNAGEIFISDTYNDRVQVHRLFDPLGGA